MLGVLVFLFCGFGDIMQVGVAFCGFDCLVWVLLAFLFVIYVFWFCFCVDCMFAWLLLRGVLGVAAWFCLLLVVGFGVWDLPVGSRF